MDLREKVSLSQKVAEYSIRLRLPAMLLMAALCAIAFFNIDGVFVSILPLSDNAMATITDYVHGDFHTLTMNSEVVFALLALFLFRWKFFGFKCGLLWFFFLLFNAMFLLSVAEYKNVITLLMAVIFFVSITSFFFISSLFIKSMFPAMFLAYTLSAWLLFLGVSNLAWYGLVSMFFADVFHLIFVVRYNISEEARKKKTLGGAIAHGAYKTIPVSLLTIVLLIVIDAAFYFTSFPMLVSESLLKSIAISACYALWMPFFAAALLSFCPLENTCEKIKKKSR